MPRVAFTEAAEAFVRMVDTVPDQAWDDQALGEWSVRDLVGHTLRACLTVEEALDDGVAGAPVPLLDSPVAYFRHVLAATDVHAAVAARGRLAGEALGEEEPGLVVRATVARVLERVRHEPDEARCVRNDCALPLIDYLPTRVVELVVHTIDLADALGLDPELPEWPLTLTIDLLGDLADRPGPHAPAALVRAITGRRPLPPGFNVLA